MYEHHKQPLAKRSVFAKRLARNGILGLILLIFSLGIGMIGYHFLEGLSWIDSLLNASSPHPSFTVLCTVSIWLKTTDDRADRNSFP